MTLRGERERQGKGGESKIKEEREHRGGGEQEVKGRETFQLENCKSQGSERQRVGVGVVVWVRVEVGGGLLFKT